MVKKRRREKEVYQIISGERERERERPGAVRQGSILCYMWMYIYG
jgi:hypothetical protein